MKLKSTLTLLSIAIALSTSTAWAQVNPESFGLYNEALTFSQTQFNGSARIQGIGGAQVALGGDISSALSNPAGLGFYNRSEFSLTPSLNFFRSDAKYDGDNNTSILSESENFNFNQLGVVINRTREESEDGFRGGSFAITLSRTNSFKNEFTYDGFSKGSSIVDFFLEQADGVQVNLLENDGAIFDSGTELLSLAYNSFLINPIDGTNDQYETFVGVEPRQRETVKVSGAQYQWNISGGANYKDQLYFGGGLGIATLNYKMRTIYNETEFIFDGQPDDFINGITLEEETDIDGIGVNATFGLIFRPVDVISLGLSYVTPTWYEINDDTFSDLSVSYNNVDFNGEILNDFNLNGRLFASNYSLRTPSKLNFGVAYFFGKNGFLTGDIEMVDYSGANLGSDDFSPTADNQTIRGLYRRAVNFRVGSEYRIDNFRLRAGYAYWSDPIENSTVDGTKQNINVGFGYRNKKFFADVAVINAFGDQSYSPYFLGDGSEPEIALDNKSTNVAVTVGFNF